MYQAAHRLYGGWVQALRANNVDPDAVNEHTISKLATLAKLMQFIRSRHAAAEPLNLQIVRDHYKAEYGVACRLCGGWRQAIEASGIKYSEVSINVSRKRIGKTEIDNYVMTRFRDGQRLNTTAVIADNRLIHTAACRPPYGGWKAALDANGIPYSQTFR